MALSFLYRLLQRVLELLFVHRMDEVAKELKILVLRHQLAVLGHAMNDPRMAPPS